MDNFDTDKVKNTFDYSDDYVVVRSLEEENNRILKSSTARKEEIQCTKMHP